MIEKEPEKNQKDREDADLVAAALLDKDAFPDIIKKYEAPIRRYIKRMGCRDEDDTDDLMQEIFIKVFINLNNYDSGFKFSSWLYRIAHNETVSLFRKKKTAASVLEIEDVEGLLEGMADETDFVELAHQRYDAKLVQEAISGLDQKYKEVLLLRFLEDKSYTEISDILKVPEGTVATLLNRGKKELKKSLETKGIK